MSVRSLLVLLVLTTLIAGGAVVLSRPTADPLELQHGVVLPAARPLPEFGLLDQHARAFTRAGMGGRWTLLFAGFTHCPDICPATLATLATLDARLEGAAENLQMVFLSLDPERDDPDTLARYLAHFHPRVVGLTGTPGEIDRVASAIGLSYMRVPLGEDYTVDHSAALMLIDPRARVVAYFRPPLLPDALAADLAPVIARRR
jgi:protein SCO1